MATYVMVEQRDGLRSSPDASSVGEVAQRREPSAGRRDGASQGSLRLAAAALAIAGLVTSATALDRTRPLPSATQSQLTADVPDLSSLAPKERKAEFFEFLKPIAADVFAEVESERAAVLAIAPRVAAGKEPSRAEHAKLLQLAAEYDVEVGPQVTSKQLVSRLTERIDAVPMPLLLVQAAKESGWGTSRFARDGNSLFGERCYSTGCGIAPAGVPNPKFAVRSFPNARESVHSYVRNINTHARYKEFRRLRSSLRDRGETLDSVRLAATLEAYSERRAAYVTEVKQLVAQNGLSSLD